MIERPPGCASRRLRVREFWLAPFFRMFSWLSNAGRQTFRQAVRWVHAVVELHSREGKPQSQIVWLCRARRFAVCDYGSDLFAALFIELQSQCVSPSIQTSEASAVVQFPSAWPPPISDDCWANNTSLNVLGPSRQPFDDRPIPSSGRLRRSSSDRMPNRFDARIVPSVGKLRGQIQP